MGNARRNRQTREQERRRARTIRLLMGLGVAVAVVAALIVVQQVTSGGSSGPDASNLAGVADVQAEFDGLPESKGTIGKPSAKVRIVEYGDLRCPICQQFDTEVVPQIVDDIVRPGSAKLEFRVWPILGPNSVTAARAAYAARQQNALWRYAALTYLNQGDENEDWFTAGISQALAKGVGLDLKRFDADRTSAAANALISGVNGQASALGLRGTPSIRVIGPKGSLVVDATYDAIASGVQQVSGGAG